MADNEVDTEKPNPFLSQQPTEKPNPFAQPVKKKEDTQEFTTSSEQPTPSSPTGGQPSASSGEKVDYVTNPNYQPKVFKLPEYKVVTTSSGDKQEQPAPTKTIENSYTGDLYNAVKKGSVRLGRDIAAAPEAVYNLFALPQNIIADYTGLDIGTSAEEFGNAVGVSNLVKDFYQDAYQKMQEIPSKYGDSVYENFKNGEYQNGFALLGEQIVESLPYSLSIMIAGTGLTPSQIVAATSVVSSGGKGEDIKDADMKESMKTIDAWTTGLAEAVSETMGTAQLGVAAKEIIAKEGAKTGYEIIKSSITDLYKNAIKSYGLPAAVLGEGIEEAASQFAENAVDKYTGLDPNRELTDGVVDATLVGMGSGGLFFTGIKSIESIASKEPTAKDIKQVESAMTEKGQAAVNRDLNLAVNSGEVTQDEADGIKANIVENVSALNKVPKEFSDEKKAEAVALIKEKTAIEGQIESLDPALAIPQKERIKQIDEQLMAMTKVTEEEKPKEKTTVEQYGDKQEIKTKASEPKSFAASIGEVEDISDVLEGGQSVQVGDTKVILREEPDKVVIESIETPVEKQGKGAARQAMDKLIQQADAQGKTMELTVAPKENASEQGFTESDDLTKIHAELKEKYGNKKGDELYQVADRLVNPNKNTIIEIRRNGVVVKEGQRYIFKPFGNTDANHKKWVLYKGVDISDTFPATLPTSKERLTKFYESLGFKKTDGDKMVRMPAQKAAEINNPEFKKWFGASKAVDEKQAPKVFYHGTTAKEDFAEFKGDLIFVSPDAEYADIRARTDFDNDAEYGENARIIPVYVKTENPFDFTKPENVDALIDKVRQADAEGKIDHTYNDFGQIRKAREKYSEQDYKELRESIEKGSYAVIEQFVPQIKELGFDGLYVNEKRPGTPKGSAPVKNLAVFNPEQVKFALKEPSKTSQNDRENKKRVPSQERERKEPKQAKPEQEGGAEASRASRVLQSEEEVAEIEDAVTAVRQTEKGAEFSEIEAETAAAIHLETGEPIEKAVDFVNEQSAKTREAIRRATELFDQITELKKDKKNLSKVRELTKQRRELLDANPEIKLIDDNIKKIYDQLEKQGIIKRSGNCP